MEALKVESLDQEGRGVARRDGKAVFVEGALPGEVVTYSPYRKKPTYEVATLGRVLKESPSRVRPRCPHFGVCGGCSLQHLDARAQVAVKQRVLEDSLWHIGRVRPERILPAIHGPAWGYRHRARLAVRYVPKKGGALVGFHEKRSSYVADMGSCEVLPPRISALIRPLRELVSALSIRNRLPQIEVALGEGADVLVFRVLEPLLPPDTEALRRFADRHGVRLYLQPGGPETAAPMAAAAEADLHYTLPEFGLKIRFAPTEFTQVNPAVNGVMVRRALSVLDPRPGERIADLFCGVGNFTLAVARSGATVLGVESSADLVRRAGRNAELNGLSARASFVERDLYRSAGDPLAGLGRFDRMLLDPPRDGAVEVVKALPDDGPQRLVYVSCNPGTLARDAAVLTQTRGYRLSAAGVINMFPHTSHVESMAVFDL
ncbi:MAG: 23S rRNA (uracil(1939)-C(5))-methyltransferase [Betaproteobacteria bacterium RIFCSPLOWO2_02_FULL_67_26]|nr:MAG: 23S rRNA (uracil(1939)-C(5))-methyltransferase [Betaproteobacteria bacterium RIFCSPLOWO2_02_FULL_67_26]